MQLRVIERVEKLGAELNLIAFRSLRQWNPTEYFKQREIPVVAARPNDDIASCGAERQRHRRRKRIRLEPLVYLLGTVIRIAEENGPDLDDLPEDVRRSLEVHMVEDLDEVLTLALRGARFEAGHLVFDGEAPAEPSLVAKQN